MKVTVNKIFPDEALNISKMRVEVSMSDSDEKEAFGSHAFINVYIDKHDATLDELKTEAIQKAIEFLKSAISDRS